MTQRAQKTCGGIEPHPKVLRRIVAACIAAEFAPQATEPSRFMRPSRKWKKRKPCPAALRKRVFAAFPRCEYCGWQRGDAGPFNYSTVDRIVPHGGYLAANVTMACLRCNSFKGMGDFIGPVRSLTIMEAHRDSPRP